MTNDDLEVTENISKEICTITTKGRIDANSADMLLFKLENALKNGQKAIVLNMSQVKYLSSVGIRVILKIYKQANETGSTFKIERPSDIVKNVLGMVALSEMLVTD